MDSIYDLDFADCISGFYPFFSCQPLLMMSFEHIARKIWAMLTENVPFDICGQ